MVYEEKAGSYHWFQVKFRLSNVWAMSLDKRTNTKDDDQIEKD